MKKLVLNAITAVLLFGGSLVGALAASGRLHREGVANIPLLRSLFPAPPKPAEGDAAASASDATGSAPAPSNVVDPLDQGPRRAKTGRSLFEKEKQEQAPGGDHATDAGANPADAAHAPEITVPPSTVTPQAPPKPELHAAERDFEELAKDLAQDRRTKYAPGGYFTFEGLPAGVTPEKVNEAWQRVESVRKDLDRREQSLKLREGELKDLADDVARRQSDLGRERAALESLQKQLDDRFEQFQQQVKLVRTDEAAGLRRNAETWASFEASKAAALADELWRTAEGQDEVVKTFEYMDKDALHAILQALPNAMVREVLQKRLKVIKEPKASKGPNG